MRFKEYLFELLDSKVIPELIHEVPHKSKIYELNLDGNVITFTLDRHEPGWWTLYFKGLNDDGEETFDLTNKGDQFKIFSATKWILDDLIRDRAPDKIDLEAMRDDSVLDPEKRINLYRKLINKFKNSKYKVVETPFPTSVFFTLVRRKL